MPVILGIDAAWTTSQPSGVALISGEANHWRCLEVAPSYATFGDPRRTRWSLSLATGECDVGAILKQATLIANAPVDVVVIDLPMSSAPISGRRPADDIVSRRYGSRKCGTHSPSIERPGELGKRLLRGFEAEGFSLITLDGPRRGKSLLEAYPHVALLELLRCRERYQYKVKKSTKYWPLKDREWRIAELIKNFSRIVEALDHEISHIDLPLPATAEQLEHLKRYEDAIDAMVCCWLGSLYLNGNAEPLGDKHAAIWCPRFT